MFFLVWCGALPCFADTLVLRDNTSVGSARIVDTSGKSVVAVLGTWTVRIDKSAVARTGIDAVPPGRSPDTIAGSPL